VIKPQNIRVGLKPTLIPFLPPHSSRAST